MKHLNSLPHIDWQQCIHHSNNKPGFAEKMLTIFIEELHKSVDAISDANKSSDTFQLQIQVHKLHGACCYSGVPRLRQLTSELETLIKTDPDNAKIHEQTQCLLTEAKAVVEIYDDGNYK